MWIDKLQKFARKLARAITSIIVKVLVLTTSHVDGIRSVSVAKGVIAFGQVEGAWGGTTYVTLLQETVRA